MSIQMDNRVLTHRPEYTYLSPQQQERIHKASLDILHKLGVYIYDPKALELFGKAGATVESDGKVFISPGMVEDAVSSAPKQITLHTREGEPALQLKKGNVYYGPGSDCLFIHDHETEERRTGTVDDVERIALICDALPNIDFLMSGIVPADVPTKKANLLQMKLMMRNSTKPIMFVTNDFESSVNNVEAAEVAAGGEKQLRNCPYVCCYINVTDPLRHNQESLQKVLFLSEKGVPTTYTPMVLRGVNGPVTSAGATALANAGELVGLVLSQLSRKGAPVLLSGGYGDVFDMRTMAGMYTGPESYGTRPAMGSFYGLPVFGLGGASDAKLPDEQAMIEASLTLHFETLCNVNMVHDVGYLESGKMFSLEQLVICDEIIGYIRRFSDGIEVSDETLALDVVMEERHHGEYLGTEHTVTHFRENWQPTLFDRNTYDGWKSAGAATLRQRAKKKVRDILTTHQPKQMAATVRDKVDQVLDYPSAIGT